MAGITQYQPYGLPGISRSFIAKAEAAGFIAAHAVSVVDQYRFPQIPYSFDAEHRAFLLDLQRCLSIPLTGDSFPGGTISPVDIITQNDIRYYGAIEDGVTDNSVAIQAAIDFAEQDALLNRGRGKILIPCVTGLGYMCDADIQLKAQTLITGGGMIKFSGTYGFESNGIKNWWIDGITIVGSKTAGQIGIYSHNGSGRWWIQNCQMFDFPISLFLTKTYVCRIQNNYIYPTGMDNITLIKMTRGEGNCSKGTEYGIVNAINISDNILSEYSAGVSPTPLIHIGDSALAPIDPKALTHAKAIRIYNNSFSGKLAENAIKVENTRTVVIENNWFERLMGPAVYLAGQHGYNDIIRANGFRGNNNDDSMDPAIKIDSTINWPHTRVTIAQNEFQSIHANHNFLEADYVNGLVLDSNYGMTPARTIITNSTGVDIRQSEWTHIVHTFTDEDATPSVKFRKLCKTANTAATTITMFDDGTIGEPVTILIDDANTTIDFTGTNLKGNGGADWSPASGDHMIGIFDGTDWFFNVSDNIS